MFGPQINPKHLEQCLGIWWMLSKYFWKERMMRNIIKDLAQGLVHCRHSVNKLLWLRFAAKRKQTKPSKARGGNTLSTNPAVLSTAVSPTEGLSKRRLQGHPTSPKCPAQTAGFLQLPSHVGRGPLSAASSPNSKDNLKLTPTWRERNISSQGHR